MENFSQEFYLFKMVIIACQKCIFLKVPKYQMILQSIFNFSPKFKETFLGFGKMSDILKSHVGVYFFTAYNSILVWPYEYSSSCLYP